MAGNFTCLLSIWCQKIQKRNYVWTALNGNPVCTCSAASVMSLQPMNCSLPGSSVHGIFQAWILGWVAVPSSSDGNPEDRLISSLLLLTSWYLHLHYVKPICHGKISLLSFTFFYFWGGHCWKNWVFGTW